MTAVDAELWPSQTPSLVRRHAPYTSDHLPEEHKPSVRKKLRNAYAMAEYSDAKRALERLHRELMGLNPSAARSLEEGMEETLTVRPQFCSSLASL